MYKKNCVRLYLKETKEAGTEITVMQHIVFKLNIDENRKDVEGEKCIKKRQRKLAFSHIDRTNV